MSENLVLAVSHQRHKDVSVIKKDPSHSISVVIDLR